MVVVKVSHVWRGMVGQSSYTFWVAVCVAIVIYCENFKFSRNRYRINCLGKKISKNTSTQNSRAGEMLMTIQRWILVALAASYPAWVRKCPSIAGGSLEAVQIIRNNYPALASLFLESWSGYLGVAPRSLWSAAAMRMTKPNCACSGSWDTLPFRLSVSSPGLLRG